MLPISTPEPAEPLRATVQIRSRDADVWLCRSAEGVGFVVARDPAPPGDYAGRPANGGIRIKGYGSDAECLREAEALARRMTEKQALYNVGFSGAKITVRADPETVDKHALMRAIGQALCELDGAVYTGADLNVTESEIALLAGRCPYVLAGIGTSVDTNVATAHGVVGALVAAVGEAELPATRILVHGLGKVGRAVADELLRRGCRVATFDRAADRARRLGAENLSHVERWWTEPVDAVVLCSDSYAVDPARAGELRCRLILGSANLPFAEQARVCEVLRERRILFLPDQLTSAGATISDSIEYYCPDAFRRAEPEEVYGFVHRTVRRTTARLLRRAERGEGPVIGSPLLYEEIERALGEALCGERFEPARSESRAL